MAHDGGDLGRSLPPVEDPSAALPERNGSPEAVDVPTSRPNDPSTDSVRVGAELPEEKYASPEWLLIMGILTRPNKKAIQGIHKLDPERYIKEPSALAIFRAIYDCQEEILQKSNSTRDTNRDHVSGNFSQSIDVLKRYFADKLRTIRRSRSHSDAIIAKLSTASLAVLRDAEFQECAQSSAASHWSNDLKSIALSKLKVPLEEVREVALAIASIDYEYEDDLERYRTICDRRINLQKKVRLLIELEGGKETSIVSVLKDKDSHSYSLLRTESRFLTEDIDTMLENGDWSDSLQLRQICGRLLSMEKIYSLRVSQQRKLVAEHHPNWHSFDWLEGRITVPLKDDDPISRLDRRIDLTVNAGLRIANLPLDTPIKGLTAVGLAERFQHDLILYRKLDSLIQAAGPGDATLIVAQMSHRDVRWRLFLKRGNQCGLYKVLCKPNLIELQRTDWSVGYYVLALKGAQPVVPKGAKRRTPTDQNVPYPNAQAIDKYAWGAASRRLQSKESSMTSRDEWLKQFNAMLNSGNKDAETMPCPSCDQRQLEFRCIGDLNDRIAYGSCWCNNCLQGIHVSRMRVPTGIPMYKFGDQQALNEIPDFKHIEK